MSQSQLWIKTINQRWKPKGPLSIQAQGQLLKKGIGLLESVRPSLKKMKQCLPGQPFDLHLLNGSSLFRKSRELYLKGGGKFVSALISSPRSLSSTVLLEEMIEYSPIEKEIVWSATNPIESKKTEELLKLRTYSSSLFHEQNHRILWRLLPPPEKDNKTLHRFLNFAESMVITLDMALADHLGPSLATLFYLIGVTYDPGTLLLKEIDSPRIYRNYLQAVLHSTYLNLELFDSKEIYPIIRTLFPQLGKLADRAVTRSLNLDRAFVENTNPVWQKKNSKKVMQVLTNKKQEPLRLSDDPMNYFQQYLIAEKYFDLLKIR